MPALRTSRLIFKWSDRCWERVQYASRLLTILPTSTGNLPYARILLLCPFYAAAGGTDDGKYLLLSSPLGPSATAPPLPASRRELKNFSRLATVLWVVRWAERRSFYRNRRVGNRREISRPCFKLIGVSGVSGALVCVLFVRFYSEISTHSFPDCLSVSAAKSSCVCARSVPICGVLRW